MILTKTIKYYGKDIPVESLSKTSGKKVKVRCPTCGTVRNAYYRIVVNGNHRCHKCTLLDNRKNLKIGDKYNRLTVVKSLVSKSICKCDCGKYTIINNYALRRGTTKSCGCLKLENLKKAKVNKGAEHGNWKGGIAYKRNCIMQSAEYKRWRISVFERDKYTCQKCNQIGYKLNAHHIISYTENKNGRLDVSNGITLCEECHRNFHKLYGRKDITHKDINNYINNPLKGVYNGRK